MEPRKLMLDGKVIAWLDDNEADHLLKFAEYRPARTAKFEVRQEHPPIRPPMFEELRRGGGAVVQDSTTVGLELLFLSQPRVVRL